ncbi:MAG TPA: flagellar basal body L-ring protein FlgH [Candidatus Acidoferrales bacterium]|jgi:flagellar L-ring protein precursor FlgH|nr:flagellar basal body L-ring protein FlgH [Candidatus Acidoferrales bacterium]
MKINPRIQVFTVFLLAQSFIHTAAVAQSLWHDDASRMMFADKRAAGVGDILTVVVQENTVANKNNETKTEKSSSLSAAITSFLYPAGATSLLTSGGKLPAMAYNSDLKHDGSGAINNSESIVAHIAVKVIAVLPNRSLVVEGKRETSFSGEKQTILLHGLVRAEDVNTDNTVLSYNIADATIQIIGKGTVSNAQNKGWFTKIYEFVNPF